MVAQRQVHDDSIRCIHHTLHGLDEGLHRQLTVKMDICIFDFMNFMSFIIKFKKFELHNYDLYPNGSWMGSAVLLGSRSSAAQRCCQRRRCCRCVA